MRDHSRIEVDEYLTDEFSNEAVSFVRRSKDKPFFRYLSYNAPHSPLQASKKYLDRIENIKDKRRQTYAAMDFDGFMQLCTKQNIKPFVVVNVFASKYAGGPSYEELKTTAVSRGRFAQAGYGDRDNRNRRHSSE